MWTENENENKNEKTKINQFDLRRGENKQAPVDEQRHFNEIYQFLWAFIGWLCDWIQ